MASKFPLRKRKRPDTKESITAISSERGEDIVGKKLAAKKKETKREESKNKNKDKDKNLEELPILSTQFIKRWKEDLPELP